MTRRPQILVLVQYFRPAFRAGGAARSIANLVDHLGSEYDFHIVCRDRDLGESAPFDRPTRQWVADGLAQVWYEPLSRRTPLTLWRILRSRRWDAVYCNSYFNPVFSLFPRLLFRLGLVEANGLIVAPRGEFARDAIRISAGKKRWLRRFARVIRLDKGALVQASVDHEARDIARLAPELAGATRIAADLTAREGEDGARVTPRRKTAGAAALVLVARIAPIKNILFAIEALGACRHAVTFDLYGPLEDADYWRRCEAAIARLPRHVEVRWHGPVAREDLPGALAAADALLLPTLGENFGHAIYEALNAGLPAIISDQTVWRDLLPDRAGWDLPLGEPAPFTAAVDAVAAMDEAEFAAWRDGARERAAAWTASGGAIAANRALLDAASGRSALPCA